MGFLDREPKGWRTVPILGGRVFLGTVNDRVSGLSAEIAFFLLLSLPPAFLAILGSIGWVAGLIGPDVTETIRQQVLSVAGTFLTESAREDVVRPAIDTLLEDGQAAVASVGILLTLWSASRATTRTIEAVAIAYDVEERRSAVRLRLLALAMTVGMILVVVIVLPLLVAGPALLERIADPLGVGNAVAEAVRFLYWPAAAALGIGILAAFYHFAVPWTTRWRRDLPGAVLAALVWLGGGLALRFYGRIAIGSDLYGPLAAPIVFLLWLYVTAFAVLLGAELNAEIERAWPTGAVPKGDESPREIPTGEPPGRERRRDRRQRDEDEEVGQALALDEVGGPVVVEGAREAEAGGIVEQQRQEVQEERRDDDRDARAERASAEARPGRDQ
jgi:membrane protein